MYERINQGLIYAHQLAIEQPLGLLSDGILAYWPDLNSLPAREYMYSTALVIAVREDL